MDRYMQIFRQPGFRTFWAGFTASTVGDAMTRVALTWFVYETTGSAQAIGWLMLWYTGPVVVGGLAAGWLLDRFDRRWVMLVDNAVRGAGVLLIPILHGLGLLAVWHLYAFAGLYGLLLMVSLAGSPAMIPALVHRDQIPTANALETLSFMLGGIVGPVFAGALIVRIGAPNVLLVDGLSYLFFAAALARLRVPARPLADGPAVQPSLGLRDAVSLLLTNRVLLATTLMFMTFNIGGGFLAVWLPVLTDRSLSGGPELYGTLLGALAVGEVASAFLAGARDFRPALGTLICLAQLLAGISLGLLLAGQSAWLAAAGLFLFGAFSAPLTIWAQTLRMDLIPERLRGRVFALLRMMMQSGNPLGAAMAGGLIPLLGLPMMIALSAGLVAVPGALGLRVRDLRAARPRPAAEGAG